MKLLSSTFRTVLLPALLLITTNSAIAATPYQVDTLENFPGYQYGANPIRINDKGEAIGELSVGEDASHAVFWDTNGQITNLTPATYYRVNPVGLNNASDVIYGENNRVYIWNAGSLTDLGEGYPYAVNENNQIAGYFAGTFGIWTNGTVTPIPIPSSASYSYATGINIHGDVVGLAYYPDAQAFRGFLWSNGTLLDLGTVLGNVRSYAYGINDQRQVVGYYQNSSAMNSAFILNNGVIQDLALPASNVYAFAVNNSAQVIGTYIVTGSQAVHPFVWQNGVFHDLTQVFGTPKYGQPCNVASINDKGQILAKCDVNYRLTPVAQAADVGVRLTSTPFPATVGVPLLLTSTVSNIGNLSASNVTFSQAMPTTGYSLVSMTASQGSCSGSAQITCALGNIAADTSVTVIVTVIPTAPVYFDFNVAVSALEAEVNEINNQARVSVPVYENNADVRVDSLNSQTSAKLGANITYTWVIRNTGPNLARNVTLTDSLPKGLTLVSVNSTAGNCSGATTIICNLGDIRYAFEEKVTIVAKATVRGTFTNKAVATSATPDNYTVNNTSSVTTRVR